MQSMNTYPLANLCEELTLDTLENNPFELHYSIAYPEKLGLEDLGTDLIPFQSSSYQTVQSVWSSRKESLALMNTKALRGENAYLHQLLTHYVDLQLKSLEFLYYENPLSASGGVHSQLPILLSEYAFRSKKDVENYFKLLSQIPAYLEGIAEYTRLQEEQGLPLYIGSIDKVKAQCLELFPREQLKDGTHFLQTSFQNRLKPLIEEEIITQAEADSLCRQNTSLLTDKLMPAYDTLASSLGSLKGKAKLAGLASLPKGQEYYTLLLQANTGSVKTVEELRTMLYNRYDLLYKAYITLLQEEDYIANWQPSLEAPSEILQHLYTKCQKSFPSLPQSNSRVSQQVRLKTVDNTLAAMSAPAFYMTPPVDANTEHSIYINPEAEMEPLDLYTTLAHEGFPGHLYQTVYSQNALLKNRAPLLRQLLYYGGFTEGWAVYAELYSYNFLIEEGLSSEPGNKDAITNTLLLARYNREIQLCLCTILDIYIHYDNASLEKVRELLMTMGLNPDSADSIYEVICDAPANYPKYYVGYLEILELKNAALELWGDDYSDYDFHKWLLETGGGDFGSLRFKLEKDSK